MIGDNPYLAALLLTLLMAAIVVQLLEVSPW